MPMFSLPNVNEQPEIVIGRWLVIELVVAPLPDLPGPYRFVIGRDVANQCGRASTLIRKQDFDRRRLETQSGRRYILDGAPHLDDDAWWTFQSQGGRGIPVKDVSADFWPGHAPVDFAAIDGDREAILRGLREAGYTVSGG